MSVIPDFSYVQYPIRNFLTKLITIMLVVLAETETPLEIIGPPWLVVGVMTLNMEQAFPPPPLVVGLHSC